MLEVVLIDICSIN